MAKKSKRSMARELIDSMFLAGESKAKIHFRVELAYDMPSLFIKKRILLLEELQDMGVIITPGEDLTGVEN